MKRLIEFSISDGDRILVEVEEDDKGPGTQRVTRPGEIAQKAQQSFEEAMSNIRPSAEVLISGLRNLLDTPDEVEVKFGIKLSAEVGAFIAAVGAEANYEVTLVWRGKNQGG